MPSYIFCSPFILDSRDHTTSTWKTIIDVSIYKSKLLIPSDTYFYITQALPAFSKTHDPHVLTLFYPAFKKVGEPESAT